MLKSQNATYVSLSKFWSVSLSLALRSTTDNKSVFAHYLNKYGKNQIDHLRSPRAFI